MLTLFVSILISISIYQAANYILKKRLIENQAEKYSAWLAIIFFLAIYYGSAYYGFKRPGAIFERAEYEAIVTLSIKKGNSTIHTNGKIYKGVNTSFEENYPYYLIIYLELPTGEKRYFTENSNFTGKDLRPERYVTLTDDLGKSWDIKLNSFSF